ncbi:MAG: DMT family transporter [Bacteroidetes bacterium]|nr:DMT family transporter [Bacteroidota bacterium]
MAHAVCHFLFQPYEYFCKITQRPAGHVGCIFRCFIAMIFCSVALLREGVAFADCNMRMLVGRGAVGTVSLMLYFYTLYHMPPGTAVTIHYISPVFTVVIAFVVMKQKIIPLQWISFIAALCGVAVIKGFDNRLEGHVLAAGLCSALLSATAYTLIAKMKKSERPMLVAFYFMFIGSVAGFVGMLWHWQLPTLLQAFYLLLVGITTQLGHINMTRALQAKAIGKVSILQYKGIVLALIFGFDFFGEKHPPQTLFGIALIAVSVVVNVLIAKRTDDNVEMPKP